MASATTGDQLYFTKDHDMVRRAVGDFITREINPNVESNNDRVLGVIEVVMILAMA